MRMTNVIKFESVSKKYKLYSKGGLYLRDRMTHALQRFNPFNGAARIGQNPTLDALNPSPETRDPKPATLHPLEKDFWALKNVSFEIKQGEAIGFIGRNGAGKSTILKLLAGVTKPSSGTVEVKGRVAALIEVGAGFHPELTGRENVFLNGSILGLKKVEIEKAFDSIVSFAELEEFIDTPVKHYSSGMYVRLGFAIAAHTDPDVYLIDEVLAVGDESFQKKCLDTLAAHKAAGKTMILVSHNLDKVAEVCDRCVYLSHGELRFDGPPMQAIRNYRSDVQGVKPTDSAAPEFSNEAKVEITDVIFRDSKGKEVLAIQSGSDLIVELRYRTTGRIENPVFGLGIHSDNGLHIAGFNTRTNSLSTGAIEGEGSVFCKLGNLCLGRGSYRISAAISDYACSRSFDHRKQAYRLDVSSDQVFTAGLISLAGEWAENVNFDKPFIAETHVPSRPAKWA
jgi:ABC-type polysaccharide/polyol phosphate transport system ATPase subunit